MNSRELREKGLKISHEARDLLKGDTSPETDAQFDKMVAEADALEARAVQLEKMEQRERSYNEADARRPTEDGAAEVRAGMTLAEKTEAAFSNYLRSGVVNAEIRAQAVAGNGTQGGYLVPTELQNAFILGMKDYGPMNEGGPVTYLRTATGGPLPMASADLTTQKGELIAENTEATEQDMAFGQKTLNAFLYSTTTVRMSNTLIQDSLYDVQAFVIAALSERGGRIANEHLTTGTGSGQPEGIVTAATAGVTGVSKTVMTIDDLMNLEHSIDPAYRVRGRYMFNDDTFLRVRKLKDGDGRLLWQPSMVVGAPATINGRPYDINPDMASFGSLAKPIIFGDLSKYTVRIAREISIVRLAERYATFDQTGYVGFFRLDGKLLDAKAVKSLQNVA